MKKSQLLIIKTMALLCILSSGFSLGAQATQGKSGRAQEFYHDMGYALGESTPCSDDQILQVGAQATNAALNDCNASAQYAVCYPRPGSQTLYNSPQYNTDTMTCSVRGFADGVRY